MTTGIELLLDAFGRVRELVHGVVDGVTPDELAYRVDPQANTIAWLVWHLTRIQDDHVADLAGADQAWTEDGWCERFDLPLPRSDTGFGHGPDQVGAVRVAEGEVLTGYYDAVHQRTVAYVGKLSEADFPRIVDTRWDPPVTLAVRLVSVISDDLQHIGQAAFVKGLLERR
jgi:hypothetical protein